MLIGKLYTLRVNKNVRLFKKGIEQVGFSQIDEHGKVRPEFECKAILLKWDKDHGDRWVYAMWLVGEETIVTLLPRECWQVYVDLILTGESKRRYEEELKKFNLTPNS